MDLDDDVSFLQNSLSRIIELQKQAATEEQVIRERLRRAGGVEPDSLIILPPHVYLQVLRFLNPNDIAKSDVCKGIRETNKLEWHRLATHVYPCSHIDERREKVKVLMCRKLRGVYIDLFGQRNSLSAI